MQTLNDTLLGLETRFWQSMVDNDTDTALGLLAEPAVMVSSYGAMKFDHEGYRQMAEQGSMVITSFELSDVEVVSPSDGLAVMTYHVKQGIAQRGNKKVTLQEMNDSSTWVKVGDRWKCVMHTETPVEAKKAH